MILVRATEEFRNLNVFPIELGFIPAEGTMFEVTEERYEYLAGNNPRKTQFVKKAISTEKKGKEQNKIALIIPNYNYAEWLEKCLQSVLKQTYQNYEIIFVDDMSTDNSVEIARRLLKEPHKIVELKQKRYNGGARNEAYLHMSEDVDYVWYVDSDDWLADDRVLEDINKMLQYAPDVLFISTIERFDEKERVCHRPKYKDRYEAIKGWSGSCGKVIRKELATRQECLYNEGTLKEDKNQHCRICIYMNDFLCMERPTYVWNRDNKRSVTTVRSSINTFI